MKTHFKLLFVDDDERYARPLVDWASNSYSMELIHHLNWEEALASLEQNFDEYDAVIIDGKGQKTKEGKVDDPSHAIQAIRDLEIRVGKGLFVPYVVLSKYHEMRELFDNNVFYEKGVQEDEMFKYLISKINENPTTKIKIRFPEVFSCFSELYVPFNVQDHLIEVLQEIEENTWSINSFTPLRKIIESIYIRLHEYDDNLIPYGCLRFENNQINLKYCELRLTGKEIRIKGNGAVIYPSSDPVIPPHLCLIIGPITNICSKASHVDMNAGFTKYTLLYILYGIMDLLIWFKKFVDQNYLPLIR